MFCLKHQIGNFYRINQKLIQTKSKGIDGEFSKYKQLKYKITSLVSVLKEIDCILNAEQKYAISRKCIVKGL